jgi:arylsulfatase A-like enzyme
MVRPGLICLLAVMVFCGGCARSAAPGGPDAVFLIVVDTLRPDRLSCYGSGNPTPNISRFADSGVTFNRAQAAASWTVPSMGAMMTSMYPSQLGLVEESAPKTARFEVRERRRQLAYTLPLDVQTLAETLNEAGFYPTAFVNQPFINRRDGFLQGFEEWCYAVDEQQLVWHNTSEPVPETVYPPGTDLGRADSILVDEFADWVETHRDRRPFVWLHLLKPHWPYRPPPRYMEGFTDGYHDETHKRTPAHERYDGEVRATDDLIGRALEAIDKSVGLERSLVIFTSDHGEAFGEHGGIEHGHSLHREVVHVPLVIASPGVPSARGINDYVRLIDILPTVLELIGVDPASQTGLQGSSLVALMKRETTGESLPPRIVFCEGMLYGGTERSILQNDYKLIYEIEGGERYKLFNLSVDPLEQSNASRRMQMRAADMRLMLEGFHARLLEDAGTPAAPEEDERVLRSLKALGYVGSD